MTIEARHILGPAVRQLLEAGIESARADARVLLGVALGRNEPVLPHETLEPLSEDSQRHFDRLIARRGDGEPVSRIRGWREFWSLRFALSAATLDPRPDSEVLVEQAIAFGNAKQARGRDPDLRVLDLGTGSGCLLLACLSEIKAATGIGIDINPDAVQAAASNAKSLGLADRSRFCQRSFADPMSDLGRFDIILCNPPYIPTGEICDLSREVAAHDPHLALDGGVDGLVCWRQALANFTACLDASGRAFVEIGDGQADAVRALALSAGLRCLPAVPDLSGTTRCLVLALC